MNINLNSGERYEVIIKVICRYRGIEDKDLFKILKDREWKYLLFLLLKKFDCVNFDRLCEDFSIKSKRCVNYNFKKAEEKFFINKEFRDMYFEAESLIENLEL